MTQAGVAPAGHADLPPDFFRNLCLGSGVALIAIGRDLRITAWNAGAARLLGAGVAQMLGAPVLSIIPHERRAAAEEALCRALESREVTHLEIGDHDRSGAVRELAFTISAIVDDRGECLGASIFVRDITARIRLADELAQAQKMASLGQMAGGLAHRLNNILGGIVTSVDFALSTDNPTRHRRVLEQTASELSRATRLMESLLTFAEGDQRTTDLGDLTETILRVAGRVEPDLAKASIRLELNLAQVPVVPVRSAPIEHVLMILIHNAVDAMPGGGTLRIGTQLPDGEPDRVIVDVADTGSGMAAKDIEHLFEPFYSTKHGAPAGEASSRGLGLAVVHGVVHFMGGLIRVSSKLGEGTVFHLEIPVAGQH